MSYDQAEAASDEDERDWSEWGDADEEDATKSLFSDDVLPSAQQAIIHDAREHGFDLRHFRSQVGCCGLFVLGAASHLSPRCQSDKVCVLPNRTSYQTTTQSAA